MFQVNDHKISGPKVGSQPSPNIGGKFAKGLPDTIIIHYTAGLDATSSIRTLCNTDGANRASAHLVVGRDSSVTQLVSFDTIAWHAGKSSYQGRIGFNQYAIGIEIDNAGELKKVEDKYIAWFGKEYKAEDVLKLRHRNQTMEKYWHAYTPDQIVIVRDICSVLCKAYPIKFILGHEEISPLRKVDPGPAFPLDEMRDAIFNDTADDGPDEFKVKDGKVKAELLNLRSAPTTGPIIQKLPKETKVKILDEDSGWYKVEALQVGWVKKEFIE
jgi:N-acetylmuramoyl-L-alanine amidase